LSETIRNAARRQQKKAGGNNSGGGMPTTETAKHQPLQNKHTPKTATKRTSSRARCPWRATRRRTASSTRCPSATSCSPCPPTAGCGGGSGACARRPYRASCCCFLLQVARKEGDGKLARVCRALLFTHVGVALCCFCACALRRVRRAAFFFALLLRCRRLLLSRVCTHTLSRARTHEPLQTSNTTLFLSKHRLHSKERGRGLFLVRRGRRPFLFCNTLTHPMVARLTEECPTRLKLCKPRRLERGGGLRFELGFVCAVQCFKCLLECRPPTKPRMLQRGGLYQIKHASKHECARSRGRKVRDGVVLRGASSLALRCALWCSLSSIRSSPLNVRSEHFVPRLH
jgi:hypothetical protein